MEKVIDTGEAIEDIEKLLRATHSIKQIKNHYDYNGIDITENSLLAHSYTIKESMTEEMVKENSDDDYSMLHIILLKCFQLGVQQARQYNRSKGLENA